MSVHAVMEMGREHRVFLFSPDGAAWTAQTRVTGEEIQVSDLLVVDGRVVALVSERPRFRAAAPVHGAGLDCARP